MKKKYQPQHTLQLLLLMLITSSGCIRQEVVQPIEAGSYSAEWFKELKGLNIPYLASKFTEDYLIVSGTTSDPRFLGNNTHFIALYDQMYNQILSEELDQRIFEHLILSKLESGKFKWAGRNNTTLFVSTINPIDRSEIESFDFRHSRYDSLAGVRIRDVTFNQDESMVIAGSTSSLSGYPVAYRLNKEGEVSWQYQDSTVSGEFSRVIKYDEDFVLLKFTRSSSEAISLCLLNADGYQQWQATLPLERDGLSFDAYHRSSLIRTEKGDFVVAYVDDNDLHTLQVSAGGEVEWTSVQPLSSFINKIASLVQDSRGNLIVVGSTNAWGHGSIDLFANAVSADGGQLWLNTYGGLSLESASSATIKDDVLSIYGYYSPVSRYNRSFVLKIDTDTGRPIR